MLFDVTGMFDRYDDDPKKHFLSIPWVQPMLEKVFIRIYDNFWMLLFYDGYFHIQSSVIYAIWLNSFYVIIKPFTNNWNNYNIILFSSWWLYPIFYWCQWTAIFLQFQRCKWTHAFKYRLYDVYSNWKELLWDSILPLFRYYIYNRIEYFLKINNLQLIFY